MYIQSLCSRMLCENTSKCQPLVASSYVLPSGAWTRMESPWPTSMKWTVRVPEVAIVPGGDGIAVGVWLKL